MSSSVFLSLLIEFFSLFQALFLVLKECEGAKQIKIPVFQQERQTLNKKTWQINKSYSVAEDSKFNEGGKKESRVRGIGNVGLGSVGHCVILIGWSRGQGRFHWEGEIWANVGGGEGEVSYLQKSVAGRENKWRRWEWTWPVQGTESRPAWLEQSELGKCAADEEEKGGRYCKDLGVYWLKLGAITGFQHEWTDLIYVLKGSDYCPSE